MVRRKYVIFSVPVSVRITDQQFENWAKIECSTETGCTEHSAAFLDIINRDEYARLIKKQTQTGGTGQTFSFTKNLLETKNYTNEVHLEQLPIRNMSKPNNPVIKNTRSAHIQSRRNNSRLKFPVQANISDVNALFKNIQPGYATIAMISRPNGQMGHSVVLAVDLDGIPILIDPSLNMFARNISYICEYLNQERLVGGSANIPMYPPSIELRGTKRDRSPLDSENTKKYRVLSPSPINRGPFVPSVTSFAIGTTRKSRGQSRLYTARRNQTRSTKKANSPSTMMDVSD